MAKGNPHQLGLNVVLIVCVWVWVSTPRNGIQAEAAVTCSQVSPCISYSIYGGELAPECCAGLASLIAASINTQDRRTACTCLIDGLRAIPGVIYDLVATLPQKCGRPTRLALPPNAPRSSECCKAPRVKCSFLA